MKRSKRINHLIRLTCLAGAVFCYSAAGYAEVMSNTALPTGGALVAGSASGYDVSKNNIMNITGIDNAVIKWKGFDIGSIATVNFSGKEGFNVLNYVASGGNMSQIHGTLNAQGGNVYLVNPAGVFIGKSAQIDVGSLYVSNKKITALDEWEESKDKLNQTPLELMKAASAPQSTAELMSLGHISATNVTFDGNRIVLDTEYVTNGIDTPIGADNITIIAPSKEDVVLGYEAYNKTTGYNGANSENVKLANYKTSASVENSTGLTKKDGYMWIEDVEQLQAMNTNVKGNYALRNGIDATNTEENPFNPINNFEGKLDGLAGRVEGVDFAIFDLHVGDSKKLTDNVGLFGTTNNATLKNLLFVSGSAVGKDNVGMLVGSANNTVIENIKNSGNVSGGKASTSVTGTNIGGVVGSASGTTMSNLLNTGAVSGYANVGGVVGNMTGNSTLTDARNLGQIRGEYGDPSNKNKHYDLYYSHNIGGLVGNATDVSMSDLQNDMTVIGGYNVGGIVGNGDSIILEKANNTADITANGYCAYQYQYIKFTSTESNYVCIGPYIKQANIGGIIGSAAGTATLNNVTNDGGNVASVKVIDSSGKEQYYYEAGNVGGIAGKVEGNASDTSVKITNAVNKENTVYGSHNVGGIAGYLENGAVSVATNNGGEIVATGGYGSGAVQEENLGGRNTPSTKIGNMGGIVGYMYGNNAYISQAGNRGNVHSLYITDNIEIEDESKIGDHYKAANAGGIVGKVARITKDTVDDRLAAIKDGTAQAAISDCYNTGDVQGFASVGGIAGQMFNGEVTSSYNLGHIQTTRKTAQGTTPVNMGGIVGESSEKTDARVIVYDVYNSGVIGSENFDYYARHVGGVVGRLSGYVEKAYNTGAIYNGSNVVGGVVGYVDYGNIKDCFNTGNITVLNNNNFASTVGGVVGGYDVRGFDLTIENVYNLGTIRSFKIGDTGLADNRDGKHDNGSGDNYVGGIIGRILDHDYGTHPGATSHLTIKNAYTLGNIYAGVTDADNGGYKFDEYAHIGAMYGGFNELDATHVDISQAYYITPEDSVTFKNLAAAENATNTLFSLDRTTTINFGKRMNEEIYVDFAFSEITNNGAVVNNKENPWRIYEGFTTPILNAFLPDAEEYFSANKDKLGDLGVASLQYGTAYNPTLTIINAVNGSAVKLDWSAMNIDKGASFAVYDGSLTINNFDTKGNYFGGTLYADGALNISNKYEQDVNGVITNTGNIMLGSGSKLYGSSIDITSEGVLTSYGSVQSTGNSGSADITLSGANGVEIIGAVKSAAAGDKITVVGIDNTPFVDDDTKKDLKEQIEGNIADPYKAMPDVADYYGRIVESKSAGDITIKSSDGDVNVLLGVAEKGYLQSAGSITLAGNSVYVDSDVSFAKGSQFTITADEAVLDISNIGKVQTLQDNSKTNVEYLHSFLAQGGNIELNAPDAIIAINMWDDAQGQFVLNQYDTTGEDGQTLAEAVKGLGTNTDKIHIWLDDAEQLQGINDYYTDNSGIFGYNFALKNDIDANSLQGFQGIGYGLNTDGTGKDNVAFTGALDGRGYSIIGLNVAGDSQSEDDYVGLFRTIGIGGSVKDLQIISSDFTGSSVGAVAGLNQGTIENVATFGNRVKSDEYVKTDIFGNDAHGVGAAGGIVGINDGTISNVTASDAVIAGVGGSQENKDYKDSTAGGIAGVNAATITGSTTNSAITSSSDHANALGGVAGINYGGNAKLDTIESLGILNGKYKGLDDNNQEEIRSTNNVGGIAGVNYNGASIENAYNEAHIIGSNGVGGVVGYSGNETSYAGKQNTITSVVNAGNITGSAEGLQGDAKVQNTGGVVGNNINTAITNARNTGTIHGEENVGGMVGANDKDSTLTRVTNDGSATIYGETNVGGVAGVNVGNINASKQDLTNKGSIHGNNSVGGVAGLNQGTIVNPHSDITLYATGNDAQYFGGVAGNNEGKITDATNTGYVNAEKAQYVGGIVGINSEGGSITGASNTNSGKVVGGNYVGGIAGLNRGEVSGSPDDPTKVRNDGYVHAINGGAGGVFGVNEKDLTNVTMINGGVVYGAGENDKASGTGGLIGVNYGDINQSNLIGEVDGVVIGSANVGGLLGINYGTVAGGRDDDNNYYAHQVYNNGTVVGGEYSEIDGADAVAVKDAVGNVIGYYTVDTSSSNIGGVVGNNAADTLNGTGALTAAYNTGKVLGGTSVGGVVGNNESAVDQVFNAGTVNDGTNQQVIGNKGANSRAFDYYDLNGEDYSVDNDTVWKSYDGGAKYGHNKLLSVFLTKIKFDQAADAQLLADGQAQKIVVKAVDSEVNVYTKDAAGKDVLLGSIQALDPKGAHSMADYLNSMDKEGLNDLLSGKTFDAVGTYNLFTTQQINVVGKSHNNLGYDIEPLTVKVVKYDPSKPVVPPVIDPVVPPVVDPNDPRNYDLWEAEDKYPWYGWDKQRNERERKAEVNFVDGGMEID